MKRIGLAVVVLLACVVMSGCATIANPVSSESTTTPPTSSATPSDVAKPKPTKTSAPAEPMIPKGYSDAFTGLAYKWVDPSHKDFRCDYGTCAMVRVYAYASCPTLVYISANAMDGSGTIVDFANDTLPSIKKGQKALLTLTAVNESVRSFELTEVSCM